MTLKTMAQRQALAAPPLAAQQEPQLAVRRNLQRVQLQTPQQGQQRVQLLDQLQARLQALLLIQQSAQQQVQQAV